MLHAISIRTNVSIEFILKISAFKSTILSWKNSLPNKGCIYMAALKSKLLTYNNQQIKQFYKHFQLKLVFGEHI